MEDLIRLMVPVLVDHQEQIAVDLIIAGDNICNMVVRMMRDNARQ